MGILEEINQYLSEEIALFKRQKDISLSASEPLLRDAIKHFTQRGGKYIRPILLLLSAKICSHAPLTSVSIRSAVSVELFHEASLIHDDVVDTSSIRHGIETINATFNNKIAVLVGDFFLSSSLLEGVETGNLRILRNISFLAKSLTQGEIAQLSFERGKMPKEEDYLSIIRKKTASLFSSCTEIGAISVGAPQNQVEKLKSFGEWIGMCFQIKDDIFDYLPSKQIGKPTGNDIREGKVTLPLLYVLNQLNEEERGKVLKILSSPTLSAEEIFTLSKLAIDGGGIAYSEKKMEEYCLLAEKELEIFPSSKEKELLLKLSRYIVQRDY
ncbi:MAG TPA: polyprenyl synthetase [Porphyromonadaceae bacterium]|nr:polyprenyl synthetase [Porphyromonadaceae bacterium]